MRQSLAKSALVWIPLALGFVIPHRATAQDSTTVTTLWPGTLARYRLTGDTTWVEGRLIGVGSCIMIGPMTADAAGGYLTISMSAVERLLFRRPVDSVWVVFPEARLAKLRECQP